ncbi:Protein of unknown function [Gracilibacillus ureilyticus]|uniref:DUF2691 domain-containing protein n=1 Tax=Gracilibacillus ureilyticus TaxID=531814 RepID=A0A1H9V9M5_9BACI|nr:DUF2691 family protein [Gracilibacillus ureilyticus]SES18385.1 Protein of unknown function [Gracilibacillus ureilyticus]
MRGLSFEIPNAYGKYLFDILNGTNLNELTWKVGGGESYFIENNTLGKALFPTPCLLDGRVLFKEISKENYYLIFIDLKGFAKESEVREIATYQEFVESECQFILLLVDSSYVTIYAKDEMIIKKIFAKAVTAGYKNIEYITDENDERTTLIAF